ncbi:DUF1893 domain-containing protein [Anaerocaecibacter muris]|uniref:DUF1893 domain-containing protein n=1 Tax=Anaerocaecibacter muris TaxID=2941513 RepID=UPI003F694350
MSTCKNGAANNALALMPTLDDGGYTCVLSDGRNTVTSKERGVAPLLQMIEGGGDYRGYFAADKVVGAAAALLYAYMGVTQLCAHVMSERAAQVCELHGIAYRCDMIVPHIINRRGDGVCPMEHAVAQTDDPRAAVSIIADKLKAMNAT